MKHLIRNICVIILLAGVPLSVAAQVKLIVKDKSTLTPVRNARVTLEKGSLTDLKTDETGIVLISSQPQDQIVLIEHPDYQILTVTVKPTDTELTLYASERSVTVEEIVVSASKFEEKKEDVPHQVTVMNQRTIQFLGQQNTGDLLQQSGQVFLQKSQQGGSSPVIRGFEASRVLIVVDGVRMNNAIFRAGHLQNVIRIDNSILDRAEIVFGPGSVVYGSDALGGVMHFHTRRPSLKRGIGGNAYIRYGSVNNEQTVHADVNMSDGKLGSLTSFTHSNFDDMKQGQNRNDKWDSLGYRFWYVKRVNGRDSIHKNDDPHVQIGSGYEQTDLLQKFYYQQNNLTSHTLNFQYSITGNVPRYDRLTDLRNGLPASAEWFYGPEQRLLTSYAFNRINLSSWSDNLRFTMAYQDIKESRHTRNFNNPTRVSRNEHVRVYSMNLDIEKRIGKFELRYGLESTRNKVASTAFGTNVDTEVKTIRDTRYPDGGSDFNTLAVYTTASFEASKKMIFTAGIRASHVYLHSRFSDTSFYPFPYEDIKNSFKALNGNIGAVWMPGAGFRFSVLGSTAFRAPNVDDVSKVFESTPGRVVVPNADLKPEYSWNGEVSIGKRFGKKVNLEVVGFYTLIDNLANIQPYTFQGQDSIMYDGKLSRVTALQNVNSAYIYGYSAVLAADITNNWSLTSSLNYTYGRIKNPTGETPLDHISPMFGRSSISYKKRSFRGEFYALYTAKKDIKDYRLGAEDNEAYALPTGMPGWYTLNIRAAYAINGSITAMAAVENITDNYYRVFSSGFSSAGRNFSVTLKAGF